MTDAGITDEWVGRHFDHLSPELARDFHPTLARARARCPVAHSDQRGGFWVVTGYEDVLPSGVSTSHSIAPPPDRPKLP